MEIQTPEEQLFTFTDRQKRIYQKLQLVGEGTPVYFYDACRLQNLSRPFETTTHLVGHLIREVESSIRAVLGVVTDSTSDSVAQPVSGDRDAQIAKLLDDFPELQVKSGESHKTQIRQILKGLEIGEDEAVARLWLKHAPSLAHGRAHRDNLNSPRPVDADFRGYVDEMETVFDLLLPTFEARYSAVHAALDPKLVKADPTREDAKWLKTNVPNNRPGIGYFFNNLKNPKWLWPLHSEGLFRHPPEPQFDPETGRTTFPTWAASRCLARLVVTDDPDVKAKVAEILVELETINFLVHLDIFEAACSLPLDLLIPVADKERIWFEKTSFIDMLLPDKVADLVNHLSGVGDAELALAFNRAALMLIEDTNQEVHEAERIFTEPKTRLDRWHYEQFISKTWESIANADWEGSLRQYCELLREYLDSRYPNNKDTGDSYSGSWLTGIEHDENDQAFLLLSTIRRIAERAISGNASTLPTILEILESSKWDVFQRIVFHVLRFADSQAVAEDIQSRVMVAKTFRDPNLFHEYSLLLASVFDRLTEEQRSTILNWIDSFVPTIDDVKERARRWNGEEISDEDAEWHIRRGKLRWLELLKDKLPDDWSRKYKEWTEHLGEISFDNHSARFQTMWAGEPAISEILVTLSSPKIVLRYLQDEPQEGGASPQELARELSQLVSERPEPFISVWEMLKELDLRYVQAFFSGIHARTQLVDDPFWSPLLAAMKWALERPDANEPEASGLSSIIGDIMSSSLPHDEVRIPFPLRFQVWSIIEILLENPNPTVEHEAQYGGKNMDPLTFSLNTVRGEAFHTLFKYINWCRRTLDVQDRTFQSTAEVLPALERHLQPAVDPSFAVRAVYGERLPSLIAFDPDWVTAHLKEFFPTSKELAGIYKATWDTFIIWTRPYHNVFDSLREQYAFAVENLGGESLYRSESAASHLSEHLIAFYARKRIEYGEGLLKRFYQLATGVQAAHVLWFIARILRESADVPAEVLERFKKLIEDRVANGTREERVEFGWLFTCEKFEAEWRLGLLRDAVSSTEEIDSDHAVLEGLAELSEQFPKLTIETTIHLVDGTGDEWKLQYWSPQLRSIIISALKGEEFELARLIVNKLVAKNLPDFRNLLSKGC